MRQFYRISIAGSRMDLFGVERSDKGKLTFADTPKFWRGAPLEAELVEKLQTLKLYIGDGDRPEFLSNHYSPICSERMMRIIQKRAGKDAQFFPAPVFEEKTGKPVSGFYLLNIARMVECLDEGRSEVIHMIDDDGNEEEDIGAVTHAVIREEKVPENVHLFRLAEHSSVILISEELYEDLLPIEQWSGLVVHPCETSWSG